MKTDDSSGMAEQYTQAFQLGEEKAFDFFFRQYYTALCFFANGYLNNEDDSKDVVQECFVKLWSRHAVMNRPEAIKSFLYTSVRNACINFRRDKQRADQRREESYRLVETIDENWLDHVTHAEMIREIYSLIHTLPPRMQEIFRKFFIEGKDSNEIADELHITPGTVRRQKADALTRLRAKLGMWLPILFFLQKF